MSNSSELVLDERLCEEGRDAVRNFTASMVFRDGVWKFAKDGVESWNLEVLLDAHIHTEGYSYLKTADRDLFYLVVDMREQDLDTLENRALGALEQLGVKFELKRDTSVSVDSGPRKYYIWMYKFTLTKGDVSETFDFEGSVQEYNEDMDPPIQEVIGMMELYPVDGDVWDFAEAGGYRIHSKSSFKRIEAIWKTHQKDYARLLTLVGEEGLEVLRSIDF